MVTECSCLAPLSIAEVQRGFGQSIMVLIHSTEGGVMSLLGLVTGFIGSTYLHFVFRF